MTNQHKSTRSGQKAASPRELVDATEQLGHDAAALAAAAVGVARGWHALLREQLTRHPYATLAAAGGVGYVLGGGLPKGAVRLLLGFGGRMVMERLLAELTESSARG